MHGARLSEPRRDGLVAAPEALLAALRERRPVMRIGAALLELGLVTWSAARRAAGPESAG